MSVSNIRGVFIDLCGHLYSLTKQRLSALFFVVLMIFGVAAPTAEAFALSNNNGSNTSDTSNNSSHKTSTTPSIGKINYDSPKAPITQTSKFAAATNAKPLITDNPSSTSIIDKATGKDNGQAVSPVETNPPKSTFTPHELTNARNAYSTKYLNKDGSIIQTNYFAPHYYQGNGSWQTINNTLVSDDNAADSGNIFGQALGKVESLVSNPNSYKTQANSWEARFTPSDFSGGMIRIKQGNSQVGFSPVNANTVNPVITTDSKNQQVVHYSNLWNGVDVEYTVESDQVKEAIIINNKDAASQVQFKVIGADLQKPSKPSTASDPQPAFAINGALGNQFNITPANLILNHYGFADPSTSGLTQSYDNGTLTVGVDSSYLQKLPANAFPAVIDPTVNSSFGTRSEGNYASFEQGGPTCYSNTCLLYAGDGYDSNNVWQSWHGALFAPYNIFQQSSNSFTSASLTLTQEVGGASWVGNTNTYNYQISNATCLTGYSCAGSTTDSGNVGSTATTINVTNIYQSFLSSGNWGGWLMIAGDDGSGNASFKAFDPDNSYVTFTYASSLPAPVIVTPQPGMTYTDPQASFNLYPESNPNDSTALQYEFQVTNGADGTGAVTNSGGFQNNTTWTVPDGVLQNGATYYLEAESYDSSNGYISSWSAPVPFRIDLREGADSTQTHDTVGPVKVDLATGNVETGVASHTTSALGGSLGVDLNYNSPIKSSPGLVGSYWNLPNGGSGIPTTTPDLQRVDQNVNFDWSHTSTGGSPGTPINGTYFAAQWNGYFTAPTSGSYNFGGVNDDWMAITVNGTQVYNNTYCPTGPCYGSSIYLAAGQVVSFQASYNQYAQADYAHIYVSGVVGQQIVPAAWFQTGVRQLQQYGLVGQYSTYTDTGVPPTIGSSSNSLFLTRTDPIINSNWSGTVPVTNGPQADWLAQWTGYLTVPATGSYVFGAQSKDGSSITVNGTQVYSHWQDGSNTGYGTAVSLTAGQSVPITVNYYQHTGGNDAMSLLVEPLGGASEVAPTSWLTPNKTVVPAG